jgi:hypothetical protein
MVCPLFLTLFDMYVEAIMNINVTVGSTGCLFSKWVMTAFTDPVPASAECGAT